MVLNKEEKAWLKRANKVLAACPPRLRFYAGGDCSVVIIDGDHVAEIDEQGGDPVRIAHANGWIAEEVLEFTSPVSAVCF